MLYSHREQGAFRGLEDIQEELRWSSTLATSPILALALDHTGDRCACVFADKVLIYSISTLLVVEQSVDLPPSVQVLKALDTKVVWSLCGQYLLLHFTSLPDLQRLHSTTSISGTSLVLVWNVLPGLLLNEIRLQSPLKSLACSPLRAFPGFVALGYDGQVFTLGAHDNTFKPLSNSTGIPLSSDGSVIRAHAMDVFWTSRVGELFTVDIVNRTNDIDNTHAPADSQKPWLISCHSFMSNVQGAYECRLTYQNSPVSSTLAAVTMTAPTKLCVNRTGSLLAALLHHSVNYAIQTYHIERHSSTSAVIGLVPNRDINVQQRIRDIGFLHTCPQVNLVCIHSEDGRDHSHIFVCWDGAKQAVRRLFQPLTTPDNSNTSAATKRHLLYPHRQYRQPDASQLLTLALGPRYPHAGSLLNTASSSSSEPTSAWSYRSSLFAVCTERVPVGKEVYTRLWMCRHPNVPIHFAGAMYPVGYRLVRESVPYREREDEFDRVPDQKSVPALDSSQLDNILEVSTDPSNNSTVLMKPANILPSAWHISETPQVNCDVTSIVSKKGRLSRRHRVQSALEEWLEQRASTSSSSVENSMEGDALADVSVESILGITRVQNDHSLNASDTTPAPPRMRWQRDQLVQRELQAVCANNVLVTQKVRAAQKHGVERLVKNMHSAMIRAQQAKERAQKKEEAKRVAAEEQRQLALRILEQQREEALLQQQQQEQILQQRLQEKVLIDQQLQDQQQQSQSRQGDSQSHEEQDQHQLQQQGQFYEKPEASVPSDHIGHAAPALSMITHVDSALPPFHHEQNYPSLPQSSELSSREYIPSSHAILATEIANEQVASVGGKEVEQNTEIRISHNDANASS